MCVAVTSPFSIGLGMAIGSLPVLLVNLLWRLLYQQSPYAWKERYLVGTARP